MIVRTGDFNEMEIRFARDNLYCHFKRSVRVRRPDGFLRTNARDAFNIAPKINVH